MNFKTYNKHRRYLIKLVHLNEVHYQINFIILISILYIFGIKEDILSYVILIVFSISILDGIKCRYIVKEQIKTLDKQYSQQIKK